MALTGVIGAILLLLIDSTNTFPHPILRLPVALLGIAAVGGLVYALVKSAPTWEVYRLVLTDAAGQEHVIPALWWYPDDRQTAEKALAAVQQAVKEMEQLRVGGGDGLSGGAVEPALLS